MNKPGGATITLPAYAKVNLGLEILGQRDDGFHEIVSVTQLISLADRLTVGPSAAFEVQMRPPHVPAEENLARRAALLLAEATGRAPTGRLVVQKSIPLAAGLGGGSSDAAAALRLLDRLWDTRLGSGRLGRLGAALGSDVPLFLGAGLNLVRGRGDVVEALPPVAPFWLVLVTPTGLAPKDKTRALYQALTPAEYGDGSTCLALYDWLRCGRPIEDAPLVNGFDAAADRVYSGFADLRRELSEALGRPVHLSGAGPTLFAVFASHADARRAGEQITRLRLPVQVARSVARRPRIRSVGAPERPCTPP